MEEILREAYEALEQPREPKRESKRRVPPARFTSRKQKAAKKKRALEQAPLNIADFTDESKSLEWSGTFGAASSVSITHRTDEEVVEGESIFQEHNSDAMSAPYDLMNEMPLQGEIMTSTTHGWDDQLGVPDLDKKPYSVNREDIDDVVLDSAEALDGVKFHW